MSDNDPVAQTLDAWLAKPVQVRLSFAESPTSLTSDGTLMHDQSLAPDSLEGWYVDVKATRGDAMGFGTVDLGVEKYPSREVREMGGDYPPQIVLSGAGPLSISLIVLADEPG